VAAVLGTRPRAAGRIFLLCLAGAAVALTPIVLTQIRVEGSSRTQRVLDLAPDSLPRTSLRARSSTTIVTGDVQTNTYGYYLPRHASGAVSVPLRLRLKRNDLGIVRLYAYGKSGVETTVYAVSRTGLRRFLGRADEWRGRSFDVTPEARVGEVTLVVRSRNSSSRDALFLDRIELASAPRAAATSLPAWLVATWVGLLIATLLQASRRLRRHWMLPILTWVGLVLAWREVRANAFAPLSPAGSELWFAAREADWFGLNHGLISGSFGALSPLTVQLFHLLIPLVGSGDAAARAATAFIGIAALAAVYALGNRAAGPIGAAVAATLALLADPFRDATVSGTATTTIILAAALLVAVAHIALAEVSPPVILLLAITGALAILADPLWFAGVVLAMIFLTLAYAPDTLRQRLRLTAIGIALLGVLILPNRLSVGDQHHANVFGDLRERAALTRAAESGRSPERPVSMTSYVFDRPPATVVGGVLTGLDRSTKASASHDEVGLAGLLAFIAEVVGMLMLLVVPRVRMLVPLVLIIATPGLFLASRAGEAPFDSGIPLWCVALAAAGVLSYVLLSSALARYGPMPNWRELFSRHTTGIRAPASIDSRD
jgi:hypothetical protein